MDGSSLSRNAASMALIIRGEDIFFANAARSGEPSSPTSEMSANSSTPTHSSIFCTDVMSHTSVRDLSSSTVTGGMSFPILLGGGRLNARHHHPYAHVIRPVGLISIEARITSPFDAFGLNLTAIPLKVAIFGVLKLKVTL